MIKKFIASLTTACFLFSFVFAPAIQAVTEDAARSPGGTAVPEDFIPSRLGMVTRLHDHGSPVVVVNIQDLHCHAEAQKNISGILKTIVEGYRLDRVFIEGAEGGLDTSWLAGVKNAALKKEIADSLLAQGRLTGSEYYAILSGQPRLLKGIEDERMHRSNIVRLGRILENDASRGQALGRLRQEVNALQSRHLGAKNRRFGRLVELHRTGRLSSPKYYAAILKYHDALPGGAEGFPNIRGYLRLQELGKTLNYRHAGRQMTAFVKDLKFALPWKEYNLLAQKTGNFSDIDAVCAALAPHYAQSGRDAQRRFPQLAPLFSFVELKARVNPLELAGEEGRLIETVRSALARDDAERETAFLADFLGRFEDYLAARVSPAEHVYVTGRYDDFAQTLAKYADPALLEPLNAEIASFDDYYRVNDERTRVFLRRILPDNGVPGKAAGNRAASPGEMLAGARDIVVVVAGGFHTEGLEALLEEKKISSIVITPSVREDARAAETVYRAIIMEQGREFAPAAPGRGAPAGMLVASDAMQPVVESARRSHLRAFGLGLLGRGAAIDAAKAAQLGITVTRGEDGRSLTLSDGKDSRRLALPETMLRQLRAAPARAFAPVKKIISTVLLKTGESTSLGYWLAKAVFPHDPVRWLSWGRKALPLQTAAIASSFLLSPAVSIGALAGIFAVQQLLKFIAVKRSHERISLGRYIGSTVKELFTYGLFMALPAAYGISYALLPLFFSNPISFVLFSAFIVFSAVFNLHRLKALQWPSPSFVATFAMIVFVAAPVMGAIGAVSMPFVAWTQVAAIAYTVLMLVAIPASKGGSSLLRPAGNRALALLVALAVLFPAQTAGSFDPPVTAYAARPLQNAQSAPAVPSLLYPAAIGQVLIDYPAYYGKALSGYISQMDYLTISRFGDLYSNRDFGPLQRKIQDIMASVPDDPARRAEIAEGIRFSSVIQKRIFIDQGVLVVGASRIDLMYTEKLLAILPRSHVKDTTLIFFAPMREQSDYAGMNFNIIGNRFIVMEDEKAYGTGGHEIGHSNGPHASFIAMSALSGKDRTNYERDYGMKNASEDWATIYEAWTKDSAKLARDMKKSSNFEEKVREVVEKFVITAADGQTFLRVYDWNSLSYSDVPFDGDVKHADLAALTTKAVFPDTFTSRVAAVLEDYDNVENVKEMLRQHTEDLTVRQLYDLIYLVYNASGNDAPAILRSMIEEKLVSVALPREITFDWLEANVISLEDLAIIGNMAPGQTIRALSSDPVRLERLLGAFPPVDGRFILYLDDLPFMSAFMSMAYDLSPALARNVFARFPELIMDVNLQPGVREIAEDFLFTEKIDWDDPDTMSDISFFRFDSLALDYTARLAPSERAAFLKRVGTLYDKKQNGSGFTITGVAMPRAELRDAFNAGNYPLAWDYYDRLLGLIKENSANPWLTLGVLSDTELHDLIWQRAGTDPAGAMRMLSGKRDAMYGSKEDLSFLTDNRTLAIAMINAASESFVKVSDDNPYLGEIVARGSPDDAAFVAAVVRAVGKNAAADSMNAYYWSLTNGGADADSPEAKALLDSFKDYAKYLPGEAQGAYQSIVDLVGGVRPRIRLGTMTANKPLVRRLQDEGRSGLSIALRIALKETLPRMFTPSKFVAGHAAEDRGTARSIVRAGKWGGILAGIGGALASAGLMWSTASASPLSMLLFATLTGIAGWAAGRFLVGGLKHVAIDAAAYSGKPAASPASIGYWIAKAVFPYDTERQNAWGRRAVPFQTAALAAFFLLSPVTGLCVLAVGFAVQQVLKFVAMKRSGGSLSRGEYAGSVLKDVLGFVLSMALPASVGIFYASYPLFVGNCAGFAVFAALAVSSALFDLNRLGGMKWSSPSLVSTFSLFGFVVFPVMGAIGALAMPIVAWMQVATLVYTAATIVAVSISLGGFKAMLPSNLRLALGRVLAVVLVLFMTFPSQGVLSGMFKGAHATTGAQTVREAPSIWQGVPTLLDPVDMVRVLSGDMGYYEGKLNGYLRQMEGLTLPSFPELESDKHFGPLQRKMQDIMKLMPRDPAGRARVAERIQFSNDHQKRIFIDHGVLLVGGTTVERIYMENLLANLPPSEVGETTLIYIGSMPADRTADGKNYSYLGKTFVAIRKGEYFVGGHEIGHSAGPTFPFWLLSGISGDDLSRYENLYGMTDVFEDWATIYEAWVEDSSELVSDMKKDPLFEKKVREVVRKFVSTKDGKSYLRVYKWNTYTDVPFSGDIAGADLAGLVRQYVPQGFAMLLAMIEAGDPESALVLAEQQLRTATPEEYFKMMYLVYCQSPSAAMKISEGLAGKALAAIPADLTFDFLEEHVHTWEDLALLGNLHPEQVGSLIVSDRDRANRLMSGFPAADGFFLRVMEGMSFMYAYFESDPELARSMAEQFPGLVAHIPIPEATDEAGEKFAAWFLFTQKMDWSDPDSQESLKDEHFLEMAIEYALRLSPEERNVFLDNLAGQNYPMYRDFGPIFSAIVRARASMNDAIASGDHVSAGRYFDQLLGLLEECERISERENREKGNVRLTSERILNPTLLFDTITDADLQAMALGRAQTDPAGALRMLAKRQRVGFDISIDIQFLRENKAIAIAMFRADPAAARELFAHNRFAGQVIAAGSPDDAGFIVDLIDAAGPDAVAASMKEHRLWLVIGQRSSAAGNRLGEECNDAYRKFAAYLPDPVRKTYESMLAKMDVPSGTMLENKARAQRWLSEGKGGLSVALRIALKETLPRMIAPAKKFIAGHAEKDKDAARAIVRAGRWGGLAAGVAGVVASAGLLWNLASSSPLSFILAVTLSGVAGWAAGRFVVGGLKHVAIDAAAYGRVAPALNVDPLRRALRVPALVFTQLKKFVSLVLFRTGDTTSLGYWAAKALFPYDAERQKAWGRRALPLQTAALGAFFLISPAAGISALVVGLAAQQLLRRAAVKRSGGSVSDVRYAGSSLKEAAAYGLFVALPAAIGISYAFVPLFMSNSISFAVFCVFAAVSAIYNLHRLKALKWSSPALVATFASLGFVVPPVMGSIGAVAMPVVAWTQVAAIVYTAAMLVAVPVSRSGWKALSPSRVRLSLRRVFAALLVALFMFPVHAVTSGLAGPTYTGDGTRIVRTAPALWKGVPSLLDPVDIVRVLNGDPGYYEDALSTYIEQIEDLTVTEYHDLTVSISFGPLQRKIQNILNALPRDPALRAGIAERIRFSSDMQKRVFVDHGILLVGASTVERVYLENLLGMLPEREVGETTLVFVTPLPSEHKADGINFHVIGKVFVVLKEGRAEVGGHEIGHTAGPTGAFWRLSSESGDDLGNYENAYGMTNAYEDWATIYAAWVEDSGRLASIMDRNALFEQKVREVLRKFVVTKDGKTCLRVYKWNTYTDVPFDGDIAEADIPALAGRYVPNGVGAIVAMIDADDFDGAVALMEQQASSPEDYYKMMYMLYAFSPNTADRIGQAISGKGLPSIPATLTFEFLETHVRSWEDLALLGNLNPDGLGALLLSDQAQAARLMAGFPRAHGEFLRSVEGMSFMYEYFASLYAQDPGEAASLAVQYPGLVANIPIPRNVDEAGMKFAEWFLFTQKMDWSDPFSQESLKDEQFLRMTIDYAMQLSPGERSAFLGNIAGQHFPMARNFGPMLADIVGARASLNDTLAAGDYAGAGRYFEELLAVLDECQKSGELEQEKNKDKDGVTFTANRTFNPLMVLETVTEADLQAMVWARAEVDPAGALRMLADRQRVAFNLGIDIQFLLDNKPLAIAMFAADPDVAGEMFVKNRFAGKVIANGSPDDAGFIVDLINAVGPDAVAESMDEHCMWIIIGERSTSKGRALGNECVEAYKDYARYLPDTMQEIYRSMLDKVGTPSGTMTANKPLVRRLQDEGRSGLSIALRIALKETLPRMFTPSKFVAGHAAEDRGTARSIVRAGKWGGILAGIGGALASAGLMWSTASASPLSMLLFATLTGIAGWAAGRFLVGGLKHVAIDAAAYAHPASRAGNGEDNMYTSYSALLGAS